MRKVIEGCRFITFGKQIGLGLLAKDFDMVGRFDRNGPICLF